MTAMTADTRRLALTAMTDDRGLDVLVVGGGVTCAGIALDAATRGLRVGIVDAQDWGAGTSSRSSKLVHGGLRYLQMLDVKLVTEALAERGLLIDRLAPHLVRAVPFLYPLQHWGETFRGREVILRVDLGSGRGHHDKVRTGGAGSKFGLSLDQLDEFRTLARGLDLAVVGLHAHLGSGILDASHWREVYAQLAALAQRFERIEIINIGGGLGVPPRPGDAPLDLAALDALLGEIKSAYPQFQLWMEPGRYLVADAGVLLARATQTKRKGDYRYVGVETGMNSLIRPSLRKLQSKSSVPKPRLT